MDSDPTLFARVWGWVNENAQSIAILAGAILALFGRAWAAIRELGGRVHMIEQKQIEFEASRPLLFERAVAEARGLMLVQAAQSAEAVSKIRDEIREDNQKAREDNKRIFEKLDDMNMALMKHLQEDRVR